MRTLDNEDKRATRKGTSPSYLLPSPDPNTDVFTLPFSKSAEYSSPYTQCPELFNAAQTETKPTDTRKSKHSGW
jgi:hypothetical protein